jgi:hypothetical protein
MCSTVGEGREGRRRKEWEGKKEENKGEREGERKNVKIEYARPKDYAHFQKDCLNFVPECKGQTG